MRKKELELNLTIKEAWNLYEEAKRAAGTSPTDTYNELIRIMDINNLMEDDYVSVISESMYNKYVIALREKGLAVASINHYIAALRTFLNWCFDHEYVSPFKVKTVRGQEEQIKFASEEDIAKLLEVKNPNDFVEMRTYVMICFIMATGARSSTIRNIKIDDVDFKNHTVTYRHLKNKKVAVIPLTSQIERILHGFIKTWDTESDFLFCDIKGGQLSANALKLSFARYSKRRGLKPISPHRLRHSYARMFIKNGGDSLILKEFLCHSTLAMTQRYVRLFSLDLQQSGIEQYNPLNVISSNKSRTKVVKKKFWEFEQNVIKSNKKRSNPLFILPRRHILQSNIYDPNHLHFHSKLYNLRHHHMTYRFLFLDSFYRYQHISQIYLLLHRKM